MRGVFGPILLLLSLSGLAAAAPEASPEGNWLTEKKNGIIQIFRCGSGGAELCGRLAWFRIKPDDPNPQGLDLKNPDPAQRSKPLCGLVFMYGFEPAEPGSWESGTVYDPDSGNTYRATMKLRADGMLDLHGYIGISLLGRSEIWSRYTQPVPSCPGR